MIYYFKHVNDFDLFVHAFSENEAWGKLKDYEDTVNCPANNDFDRTKWSIYEFDGNECVGEKM